MERRSYCGGFTHGTLSIVMLAAVAVFLGPGGPPPALAGQATVINDPGMLLVVHGSDCGKSQKKGEQNAIDFTGKIKAPTWANQGTVFLNGWSAKYLDNDHHFGEINVVIEDITVTSAALEWKASSIFADDSFDDPYEACYWYTALLWNDTKIDAHPFHANGACTTAPVCSGNQNSMDHKNSLIPLGVLSSYAYDSSFATAEGVAVLPRGFELAYLPYGKTDNHLLQIAYNFDHTERFLAYGAGYGHLAKPSAAASASQVGSGYVSWQIQSILKDNGNAPDYRVWSHVSEVAGDDVGIIQPPFTISPELHANMGCVYSVGGVETEDYVIEKVPFEYAVPVLAGWDLSYTCPDDEHVLDVGAWLHDLEYVKKPAALYGTLKYKVSSVLVDDDAKPNHVFAHHVQVFGLKAVIPLPDLVPVASRRFPKYCETNDVGGISITVRNNGKVDAAASTTTVDFGTFGTYSIATPVVPAGGEVVIDTNQLPYGCYVPNCKFRITVDSGLTVKESDETNNQANGECKG